MAEKPIPFGSIPCKACKKGITSWGEICQDCENGWVTPERQKMKMPPGEEVVLGASDAIKPIVQDNEFSREALDKVLHSGRDKSMRRTILRDLHEIWPEGMSSYQFQQRYGWLHQSSGPALGDLHREGLLSIVGWRIKESTGNREGIYALSGLAKGAWDA